MQDRTMSHDHHYRAESLFVVVEVKLPVMITVKEAAVYLRKSTWTIRRWLKDGLIEHVRIGREYMILPSALPGCPQIEIKEAKSALK